MNRNFVVGLLGGVLGSATVLILLSAAGVVGARASQVQPAAARPHEVSAATPLSSTFTYQGKLQSGGKPISATCNFQFGLWDALSGGNMIGVTQTVSSLSVNAGYFTAPLNSGNEFGVSAFTGQMRWLNIAVKCPSDADFVTLGPRQMLTAAPYASYATQASRLPWGASWNGSGTGTGLLLQGGAIGLSGNGSTYGVIGQSNVGGGIGVYGDATAASGSTYGLYGTVNSPNGYAGNFTSGAGNGVSISVPPGKVGLNVVSGQAQVAGNTIWHAGNDGTGSGLDADLLDGQHGSHYQPVGRPVFSLTPLDSIGDIGWYTSITIGTDGLGLISYYDQTNGDLKVAHCSDTACTASTTTALDIDGDVGWFSSVIIGADGLPLISYFDATNHDLKVAHCSDVACTTSTTTPLDSTGDVGRYTSITIGADGLGLISYTDWLANAHLKVAHCSNTACTAATITTLDIDGDVGRFTSITIGTDGLGLISSTDWTNRNLKVAHCSNTACTAATITTLDIDGDVGRFTSITIGTDGLGLISYTDYTNGDLKVAHCSNTICNAATTTTLDSTWYVGEYTSITIGADGLGLISYYDNTNYDLKVTHCTTITCTAATITTLDSSTWGVGQYTSITIGADGLGLISYYDVTKHDLKVAHCSNVFCVPYFRPR